MTTTTWTAESGDWNTASNWSDGVPGAASDAVFSQFSGDETVVGGGGAASLSVTGASIAAPQVTFAGTHAVGALVVEGATVVLSGLSALLFQSALVESVAYTGSVSLSGTAVPVSGNTPGVLQLAFGDTLGAGTITLAGGELDAAAGVLANPVVLSTSPFVQVATQFDPSGTLPDVIAGFGTLSGAITGTAALQLGGGDGPSNGVTSFVLDNPATFLPGGLRFVAEQVALGGRETVGAVLAASGTLALGAGVSVGAITAATAGATTIDASDQGLAVFAGVGELDLRNGSGRSTVIGAVAPGQTSPVQEQQTEFGTLSVSGGTGALTVFGGSSGGVLYGGTAGGNVLVAGADGSPYGRVPGGQVVYSNGVTPLFLQAATIAGGGDGDLLVATGTLDNVVAAAGGNETLTGAGASGDNEFFGGTGADVIVAGSGRDLVVAGAGAATISAGAGAGAVFAGSGSDVILGGAGAEYVQAGRGAAALFVGTGAALIGVAAGQGGGSLVVSGFRAGTDHVAARGYAAAPAVASAGGNTVLGFADNTRVTLLGVASLPGGAFV